MTQMARKDQADKRPNKIKKMAPVHPGKQHAPIQTGIFHKKRMRLASA
jgi:hypothetical protein